MNRDEFSQQLRKWLGAVYLFNPLGTALGGLLGVMLSGLYGFMKPVIYKFDYLNADALNAVHFIAFGIVALNVVTYMNRHKPSPVVDEYIRRIEDQYSKGIINDIERRNAYMECNRAVLKSVTLRIANENGLDETVTSLGVDNLKSNQDSHRE